MAFHAFDKVTYDKSSDTLSVVGTSERDLGVGAEIHVAVVDPSNDNHRHQTKVQDRVALDSWTVEFKEAGFAVGDDIIAAGMSKDDEQDVFVWGERFEVKPA